MSIRQSRPPKPLTPPLPLVVPPLRTTARGAALGATIGLASAGCVPPELGDRHADLVADHAPAPFTPEDAEWADPTRALGPPDGRTVAVGRGAVIVLRFFRPIEPGPGPDLRVYEVGADGARARVAVSADGDAWNELPDPIEGRVVDLELDDLSLGPVTLVRVRGLDDAGPEPGFDLDALEALR